MGETNSIIWIIMAALLLGLAIFLMGSFFATQNKYNAEQTAYVQQQMIDEEYCLKTNGVNKYNPLPMYDGWEDTVDDPTTDDIEMKTGICEA